MSTLFGVPVDAAYHLVYALTTALTPLLGGLAAVAGIIVVTIAVRLLVSPLTFRALRGQAAQARLAPEIQRLRQRFGKQPDRLQRELTALYQREGTSVFAGFAPLLVQWPVFSVLYLLFRSPTVAGGPNRLLSRDLLGVPLGSHWLSGAGILSLHGVVFVGVLAVLAAACWFVARAARRALPQPAPASPAPGSSARNNAARNNAARNNAARNNAARNNAARNNAARNNAARNNAARGSAASGRAASGRAVSGSAATDAAVPGARALAAFSKVAPYLTVVIAAFAPLAGVIYLVTSTGWSAAERLVFAARPRAAAPQGVPVAAGGNRPAAT